MTTTATSSTKIKNLYRLQWFRNAGVHFPCNTCNTAPNESGKYCHRHTWTMKYKIQSECYT